MLILATLDPRLKEDFQLFFLIYLYIIVKNKLVGLLTWTGDGWVVGELLSREQEHDLQRGGRQERDLVWEIQEVKTWEGGRVGSLNWQLV